MKKNNRAIGTEYEKLAGDFLIKQGYTVLDYNYRCFFGEIDIIAMDKETLVFCEVKYRSSANKGNPLESVNNLKQQKLIKCAMNYMVHKHIEEVPCRFDVIGFAYDTMGDGNHINHIKNAFWG